MLTPQEVASRAFPKAVMGGYNMASVDEFLDELSDDYSALYKENAVLKSKLKVLVEKVEDYRATEDSMRATLLTAQKMADSIVKEAEQKRDGMLAEAQALVDAHMAESTAERTLRPVLLPILDYVVEHRTIIGMLLDSSTASGFVDRLQKLIYRNGSRLTEAWFRDVSPEQLDYLMSFLTYGLIGLVKEWFGRGMDLPGEELVSMADRLVQGAAEGLLQM